MQFPQSDAGDSTLAEFALGIVVVLFAIGLLQHHRESFRAQSESNKGDSDKIEWLVSQFRRRTIASSLIALIGILFIADSFVWDIYWSVIMISAVVILLPVVFMLAMVDFYRTQQRLRPNIQHAVNARQALQDEADRLIVQRQRQLDGDDLDIADDQSLEGE